MVKEAYLNNMPSKETLEEAENNEVFVLLEKARNQYRVYLQNVTDLQKSDYVIPSASDYNTDRPLSYCVLK